jgi:hypothetical protein
MSETISRRGEDLASALMLCPHCRNWVTSISECGNKIMEVWESGKAESRNEGKCRRAEMQNMQKYGMWRNILKVANEV